MPVHRRAPRRALIVTLAIPVIVAVYVAALLGRVWALFRPTVALTLGAAVIGGVYADEALRRAPGRVTPLRAAMIAALAMTVVGASMAPAPTFAAKPREAVIAAAESYLGVDFRLGAEGPHRFDCSGLMFRIFADAGELPRISGKRLRAIGYMKWFASRGLASKNGGERGDLVIWGGGRHIGIYLGDGMVISALTTTGVTVHRLHGINYRFTTFLKVRWGKNDGTGGGNDGGQGGNDGNQGNGGNGGGGDDDDATVGGEGNSGGLKNGGKKNKGNDGGQNAGGDGGNRVPTGLATGTLNLRKQPGPDEKIIGWVSRGSRFKVLGTGHSPSGALWLKIEMANGKTGWIWAHWTRMIDR